MKIAEFWSLVDKTDGCWVWVGSHNRKGYGTARMPRRTGITTVMAHRISFILSGHVLPDDLTLDHLCRNTSCVRPSHLEAVTRRENTIRQRMSLYGESACLACGSTISGKYTFCFPCWGDVSADRKAAIIAAFTPGTAPSKQTSSAYWAAIDEAVALRSRGRR